MSFDLLDSDLLNGCHNDMLGVFLHCHNVLYVGCGGREGRREVGREREREEGEGGREGERERQEREGGERERERWRKGGGRGEGGREGGKERRVGLEAVHGVYKEQGTYFPSVRS